VTDGDGTGSWVAEVVDEARRVVSVAIDVTSAAFDEHPAKENSAWNIS
jgi:hypothetical protein